MKLLLVIAFHILSVVHAKLHSKQLRRRLALNERTGGKASPPAPCLVCNVGKAEVQFAEGNNDNVSDVWICETEAAGEPDGKANVLYTLEGLPQSFLDTHQPLMEQGKSRICIPNGQAKRSNFKVKVPHGAMPKYLGERVEKWHGHRNRRKLMTTIGAHTIMAVMVSSSLTGESDPKTTPITLSGNLFGTGPGAQNATVASQYAACSNNNLQMSPYTSTYVANGIMAINISIPINGSLALDVVNNATDAIKAALNISDIRYDAATHILVCLPQGSLFSGSNTWVTASYGNGVVSFYQYSMCNSLSGPMHEIGHNIGFYHSGLGSDPYNDKTGFMGYSYLNSGKPHMCFNSHKYYLAGWVDDRKVSVNPQSNGAWGGTLIPPVDYVAAVGTLPGALVAVNVGKLYFGLNSAKKFNNETKQGKNLVNVVTADYPSNTNVMSYWAASLAAGQSYSSANFNGTGFALIIQVCSIALGAIDTAKVSVYLNNGVQKSKCGTF